MDKETGAFSAVFQRALSSFQKGETERAEDLCSAMLEDNPQDGNALNLMGVIFLKQGNIGAAAEYIQKAMVNLPEKAPIFSYNLALVYVRMGQMGRAVEIYRSAAEAFSERGETEEVVNSLGKAAALLCSQGNYGEGKKCYLQLLEADKANISALNNLAIIHQFELEFDQAVSCLEQAIQIDPNFVDAHCNLGLVHLRQKNYEAAVSSFDRALVLDPYCVQAKINLGNLYLEKDEFAKAASFYEQALLLAPEMAGIHNNLGITAQKRGKLEDAISYYKKALQLDPHYQDAKQHLARAEEELHS